MAVDLLKTARILAGHNKMKIGESIKRVLPSGTQVTIVNKGKGIFEKVLNKVDGTEIRSLFRKGEFMRVDAKSASGTWSATRIKEGVVEEMDDVLESTVKEIKGYLFSTYVKGLHRPSATYKRYEGGIFSEFHYNAECGGGLLPGPARMKAQGAEWAELTHDYLVKNIKTATTRVLKYFGRY